MVHRSRAAVTGVVAGVVLTVLLASLLTACSTASEGGPAPAAGSARAPLQVAASINAWGSILRQLGGSRVHETSIITNPNTDPHDYEPTPADGAVIADARLFVENGIGYDSWAAKSVAASPDKGRTVVDVGRLVHVAAGGNPHRWYSPADVDTVAAAIAAGLSAIDRGDAGYFAARLRTFRTQGLRTYHALIAKIRTTYAGTPVGASESIFAPLAQALGLDLVTPASFLQAISEGTDPSSADLTTITHQLDEKKIKVYVYNSQNATPDVAAQVRAARAHGIPVATVTETLSPASASFEQWQSAQLQTLAAALHRATGR